MDTGRSVKVAIAQFASSNDLAANLEKMRRFTEMAAKEGATLVAFPEMAYFMGKEAENGPVISRYPELLNTFSSWAKELNVSLIPGTLREPGRSRCFNSLPVFTPQGELVATYRKVFLFKATLPDRVYNEEETCQAGDRPVVWNNLGFAICYDLRFPELFRRLRKQNAEILVIPSAFTVPTGQAHWSVLLRARAIENQCFVIAPAQVGKLGDGRSTYGHSQVISPWGECLTDLAEAEGVRTVTLNLAAIGEARAKVDAWASRREDLFPI